MEIPKIIFKWAWTLDKRLARDPKWEEPSREHMMGLEKRIREEWEPVGEDILREMSKITKLAWHEKDITCYISYGITPFSHPLVISGNSTIHDVTHELIHRILSYPKNKVKKFENQNRLWERYKEETDSCKIHIIVHAIHSAIYLKVFSQDELDANVKRSQPYSDYKKSWDIVKRDGYENIIAELTKGS